MEQQYQPDIPRIRQGDANATADAIDLLQQLLTRQLQIDPRGRTADWVDPPYDATAFGAISLATWTTSPPSDGNALGPLVSYRISGTTMLLNVNITDSVLASTGGTTTFLTIRIPDGYKVALGVGVRDGRNYRNACVLRNDGVSGMGKIEATYGGEIVAISNFDQSTFVDGDFEVRGQLEFEIKEES